MKVASEVVSRVPESGICDKTGPLICNGGKMMRSQTGKFRSATLISLPCPPPNFGMTEDGVLQSTRHMRDTKGRAGACLLRRPVGSATVSTAKQNWV